MPGYDTIQKTFPAMGTVFAVSICDPAHFALAGQIREDVLSLDARWSVFRSDSEIAQLNRLAGLGMHSVSADTLRVLGEAKRFTEATSGAFDVTAGRLTMLWKRAGAGGKVPTEREIKSRLRFVNAQGIRLDADNRAAGIAAGQSVDLGGIAKGYALDRAMETLRTAGVGNALLNFGGSVGAIGAPVTVGIQDPFRPTGVPMGTLRIENRCAVTSGSYERSVTVGGKRYHHILDPRTGRPSCSGLRSVTLVGAHAAMLDAFATGAFVLGAAQAAPLLRKYEIDAVFVGDDGTVWITEGLQDTFQFSSDALTA